MRILGWVLGGLFLTDGLLSIIAKRDLIKVVNTSMGKRLPNRVENKLRKATDVNTTALTAKGIHNLVAGTGMVLIASLIGMRRAAAKGS